MNATQKAAFELRFDDLKELCAGSEPLDGTLLAACSAHNPKANLQVRVVRFLIKKGVSVNEIDKNGVTPLHRAVRFRSPAAAEELLANGADVNAVDKKSNSTPLHRAVTNTGAPSTGGKHKEMLGLIKILLANGADPDIKNKNGKLAIDYVKSEEMRRIFSVFDADNVT